MKNKTIFLAVIASGVLGLSSCGGVLSLASSEGGFSNSDTSTASSLVSEDAPVYQGMTIVKKGGNTQGRKAFRGAHLLAEGESGTPSEEDGHTGHNQTLKNDIKSLVDLKVSSGSEVKYYVAPLEVFTIDIHFDNPKDFEIQSFTLNGKKYANYMFEAGSTMESILLSMTAPSTSGYISYTIDAVKYIDGTDIKDVKMSGDQTIQAGIAYSTAPSCTVSASTISSTAADFTFEVSDTSGLIGANPVAAYLSDGEAIVDKQDLKVGSNVIHFKNLSMSKKYQYGIATAFDLADGRDLHGEWLLTSDFITGDAFQFTNVVSGKDSIAFEVKKIDSVGSINAISLYDASTNKLVEKGGADVRSFSKLLSNHSYNLYVDFAYEENGVSLTDWAVQSDVKTLEKTAPTITLSSLTPDQNSVTYAITMEDADATGTIEKVELVKDAAVVQTNDASLSGKFDGLLSNNSYIVRVSYSYDLSDGSGKASDSIEKAVSTVAKVAPELSISDPQSGETTFSADLEFTDPDKTGSITKIELYQGKTLLTTLSSSSLTFTDLTAYTDYTAKIYYTYDLNDGAAVHESSSSYAFKTAPHFALTNTTIANTSAVAEGETIYLQANLENPSNGAIKSVKVNGQSYPVSSASTKSRIYVEIINNGQFAGGDTTLQITALSIELNETEYSIDVSAHNEASIFIYGNLTPLSLDFVNSSYEPIDWKYEGEDALLMASFANKTGYPITSLTLNGSVFSNPVKVDDEHYCFTLESLGLTLSAGSRKSLSLSEITYTRAGVSKTISATLLAGIYTVHGSQAHSITDAAGLKTMNEGFYYQLANDIDLSGSEWVGNAFDGVFDGASHKITNMSYISTVKSADLKLGLFSKAQGVIKNLTIDDATYLIEVASDDTNHFSLQLGLVAAAATNLLAKGIEVGSGARVSVKNPYDSGNYIGGLFGAIQFGDSVVTSCVNRANIVGVSGTGGICGSGDATHLFKCFNYGAITGGNRLGGISGSSGEMERCGNYGNVSGGSDVGGIYGDGYSAVNCVNAGTISGVQDTGGIGGRSQNSLKCANFGLIDHQGWGGGIVGEYGNITSCVSLTRIAGALNSTTDCVNSFTLENPASYGSSCTADQLNDKTFYTTTLGWSEDVWVLENLDVANGVYPTLR